MSISSFFTGIFAIVFLKVQALAANNVLLNVLPTVGTAISGNIAATFFGDCMSSGGFLTLAGLAPVIIIVLGTTYSFIRVTGWRGVYSWLIRYSLELRNLPPNCIVYINISDFITYMIFFFFNS